MVVSVLRQLEAHVNVVVGSWAENNRLTGENPSHGSIVADRVSAPHPIRSPKLHASSSGCPSRCERVAAESQVWKTFFQKDRRHTRSVEMAPAAPASAGEQTFIHVRRRCPKLHSTDQGPAEVFLAATSWDRPSGTAPTTPSSTNRSRDTSSGAKEKTGAAQ